MDDVLIELHQAVRRRDGGISGLARELGKQEKTMMAKLSPEDDAHQPTVGEFVAVLHRLDDEDVQEILARLVAIFGYDMATRVRGCRPTLIQAVLHAASEHADIGREVEHALEDGEISNIERGRILRECAEARRAIVQLENTLMVANP